jgi:flagellar protein FliS
MQSTELYYRKSASDGASGFGLLIMLYDTLAGNLRRAADAERNNNLEQRCVEVNHAFLVIAYLEDAIEQASGGELARKLLNLYSSMRRKLIEAQAKRSPEILEQQMAQVLAIRESWQTMEYSSSGKSNVEMDALIQENTYWTELPAGSRTTNWLA